TAHVHGNPGCPLRPAVLSFPNALGAALTPGNSPLSSGLTATMTFSNDDFRTKYRPRRYEQMWQGLDYPAIKRLPPGEERLRVPRGMISCGDYGCGKTPAARIRGMRSSCWNYLDHPSEPCGECPGCRTAMARGEGPDYFEMDATQEKLRSTIDLALHKT